MTGTPGYENFWNSDWNDALFMKWAGMRITGAKDGRATIELQVHEHHRGGGGTEAVNGGIISFMLDAVLGAAVHSTWNDGVVGQATVHLDVSYLRLVRAGSVVQGKAQVTRTGRNTVFVAGEIFTGDGDVGATGTGVYHLFRK